MSQDIELLKKSIKEGNLDNFKKVFERGVYNAHHKELFYELSYRNQSEGIYEYMEKKTSLSKEGRVKIFFKTLQDGTKIKNFNTVAALDEMEMIKDFPKYAEVLTRSQNDDFLKKFMEKFPITSFMNFKRILFGSFKNEKSDFVDYATKQELDKNMVFYYALCAVKFGKRETFSLLLKNAMKYNPTILEEIKGLKDGHLMNLRGRISIENKEEFEAFINETVIESFALHLDEELAHKKNEDPIVKKPKKLKI